MKSVRHNMILEIIEAKDVETQEELAEEQAGDISEDSPSMGMSM